MKKEQHENRVQTESFIKQKKEKQREREEKKREYEEKQMLRFGNIVDLDSLEVSGPSQYVTELQNKFHKKEQNCIKSIEEADAEFQKTQRDLTSCIQKNTGLLNLIRTLGERQLELNKQLDSTNKAIFVDEDDDKKKELKKQKAEARETVEMHTREIEMLKTEINLYKRKGGHIYTKVTTNRRSVQNQD